MSKTLVTGGAGFIGSHLVTRLVSEGHDVRVLDDLSTGSRKNLAHLPTPVELIQGDISDAATVEKALQGVDLVFHQAALASVLRSTQAPLETHAACVTGTLMMLEGCRKQGIRRFVYAGSSSSYGNQPEMPKHEGQVPQVLSPYAAAKMAAELYCESFANTFGMETVRVRYFNVFGPRQDAKSAYASVIPLFVHALLEGRRPMIYGDGLQSRDFTYVDNVVDANIRASKMPGACGQVYNIACGGSINLLDLLQEICNILDKPFDPAFGPERPGDVKHSWADISAAQRDLGYEPIVSFGEGLKKTVDWYVEQYYASKSTAAPSRT